MHRESSSKVIDLSRCDGIRWMKHFALSAGLPAG
jgi:hypothetical protein